METEVSNQVYTHGSLQISEVKDTTTTISTSIRTMSPMCGLSPNYKGSTLYDSYELHAVVHQLNKAIQGSKAFSPPYIYNPNSPFYRKRHNQIYKENKESSKKLTLSNLSSASILDGSKSRYSRGAWVVTRGVMTRLWKKVKQGLLLRNKQSN
ncbi:hypothetical protein CsatA_001597 [Cannabis sativa]